MNDVTRILSAIEQGDLTAVVLPGWRARPMATVPERNNPVIGSVDGGNLLVK